MTWVAAGMTTAEIIAAEAAAAAAAEAAAVTAAEIAAAEAATAAAQTAATEAAAEAGASAIPEAGSILEAAPSAVPPPAEPLPPAGLEQVAPAGSTPPPPAEPLPPTGEVVNAAPQQSSGLEQINPGQEFSQAELDAIQQGQLDAANSGPSPYEPTASTGQTPLVEKAPIDPYTQLYNSPAGPREVGQNIPLQNPAEAAYNAPFEPVSQPPAVGPQTYADMPTHLESSGPPNPFLDGLKSVGSYMDANPIKTAGALYFGANALGAFKPQGATLPEKKTFKNPNPLSANFNSNAQTTPNVYRPYTYKEGGITQARSMDGNSNGNGDDLGQGGIADVPRYYRGDLATSRGQKGDVYGATQRFLDMYDPASRYTPPAGASNPDVGIFRDSNPSTSNKSALEAADIRRKAIENRAYVKTGANYMPPSRDMGQLDFTIIGSKDKRNKGSDSDPVLAASGGIMQANLGGYAAGGNPRLLRGPGDGMSDNIPAMIGNKQPARLADGEFVVPADVVSHLGNGSTEAGAKRLHEMMNQVRMDRTGKKKQAPAVKAKKYIPK